MSPEHKKEIIPPYLVEGYEQTGSYTTEDEADRKVFAQLLELGADLRTERHSIHYFYFPTEIDAERACEELTHLGFTATTGEKLENPSDGNHWPVIAERIEVVNEEVIRALRKPLTEVANRNNGEYDGWEAAAD